MEKKNQHEIYARKLREKERDLRNLKKTELQLKVANEGVAHTQVCLLLTFNKIPSPPPSPQKMNWVSTSWIVTPRTTTHQGQLVPCTRPRQTILPGTVIELLLDTYMLLVV